MAGRTDHCQVKGCCKHDGDGSGMYTVRLDAPLPEHTNKWTQNHLKSTLNVRQGGYPSTTC